MRIGATATHVFELDKTNFANEQVSAVKIAYTQNRVNTNVKEYKSGELTWNDNKCTLTVTFSPAEVAKFTPAKAISVQVYAQTGEGEAAKVYASDIMSISLQSGLLLDPFAVKEEAEEPEAQEEE